MPALLCLCALLGWEAPDLVPLAWLPVSSKSTFHSPSFLPLAASDAAMLPDFDPAPCTQAELVSVCNGPAETYGYWIPVRGRAPQEPLPMYRSAVANEADVVTSHTHPRLRFLA